MAQVALTDILDVGNIDPTLEIIEITDDYKTVADTPEKMEAAFRWIVANHQYLKINGSVVDSFTGSAVVQVLNALSPTNKAKLLGLKEVVKIVNLTWKLLKKPNRN